VTIIVALSIFVLLGMIGLAIDLGRMFVIKTELQNAADACALAAARELDGNSDALIRADNAGRLIGTRNEINFQHEPAPVTLASFAYSENLGPNSGYKSSDAISTNDIANMKYAMCTVSKPNIGMLFMGTKGFGPQTVSAYAVATLAPGQTNCAIPVGLCTPQGNAAVARPWGFTVGQWYGGKFDNNGKVLCGNGTTSGNFNWIDFSPPEGGTPELVKMLEGVGQCDLPPAGTPVGQTGGDNNLRGAWNTRFGIYGPPGYKTDDAIGDPPLPPDFTGTAYTGNETDFPSGQSYATWPTGHDAYDGKNGGNAGATVDSYITASTARKSYQSYYDGTDDPANPNGTPLPPSGSPSHAANGQSRRLVVAPVVNCQKLCESKTQTVPVLDYACVMMLSPMPGNKPSPVWVEYRGLASDSDSPCATFGLAGGTVGPLVPVLVQ
jgi:hypothetical protein